MQSNTGLWVAMIVVAIIAIGAYYYPAAQAGLFGAATTDCTATTCLQGGLRITTGDFSVVTSNAATSTAAVGCIQTVATSTATPIRLVFSSVATSSPTFGTNTIGLVGWQFGTCPV